MKNISEKKKIKFYLSKYKLEPLLHKYSLVLYSFEECEILNEKLNPRQFLIFLVSGSVRIYSTRMNGSLNQITTTTAPTCFGDMEFTNPTMKQHTIETITPCKFLCLDTLTNRTKIEKDSQLLLYLLHSVSEKSILGSEKQEETSDIESKVLYYLDKESETHEIHGVLSLSQHLNCSRRQLQRVLKKLQDESIIVKKKKGVYARNE